MKGRGIDQISFIRPIEPFVVARDSQHLENLTQLLKHKDTYLSTYSMVDVGNTRCINLELLIGLKFLRGLPTRFRNPNGVNDTVLSHNKLRLNSKIAKVKKILKCTKISSVSTILKLVFYKRYLQQKLKSLSGLVKQSIVRSVKELFGESETGLTLRVNKSITKAKAYVRIPRVLADKKSFQLYLDNRLVTGLGQESILEKFKHSKRFNTKKSMFDKVNQGLLKLEELVTTAKNIMFSVKPLNFKLHRALFFLFYTRLQFFKLKLFTRNEDFFSDFVAVITLLSRRDVSIQLFASMLGRLVGSIHKRRHGPFMSLLNILISTAIQSKYSDICGIKMTFAGRVFGRDMAKTMIVNSGSPYLTTINTPTDHMHSDAFSVYGVFGLQLWVSYKKKERFVPTLESKDKRELLARLIDFKDKQKALINVTRDYHTRSFYFDSKDEETFLSQIKKSTMKVIKNDPKSILASTKDEILNMLLGKKNKKMEKNIVSDESKKVLDSKSSNEKQPKVLEEADIVVDKKLPKGSWPSLSELEGFDYETHRKETLETFVKGGNTDKGEKTNKSSHQKPEWKNKPNFKDKPEGKSNQIKPKPYENKKEFQSQEKKSSSENQKIYYPKIKSDSQGKKSNVQGTKQDNKPSHQDVQPKEFDPQDNKADNQSNKPDVHKIVGVDPIGKETNFPKPHSKNKDSSYIKNKEPRHQDGKPSYQGKKFDNQGTMSSYQKKEPRVQFQKREPIYKGKNFDIRKTKSYLQNQANNKPESKKDIFPDQKHSIVDTKPTKPVLTFSLDKGAHFVTKDVVESEPKKKKVLASGIESSASGKRKVENLKGRRSIDLNVPGSKTKSPSKKNPNVPKDPIKK